MLFPLVFIVINCSRLNTLFYIIVLRYYEESLGVIQYVLVPQASFLF